MIDLRSGFCAPKCGDLRALRCQAARLGSVPCPRARGAKHRPSRALIMAKALPELDRALICTGVTASSMQAALRGVATGNSSGADVLELRLDMYKDFNTEDDLKMLMEACKLPYIVTFRPRWEGCVVRCKLTTVENEPSGTRARACRGEFEGEESPRMAMLWRAVELGAPAIDVELAAAERFFEQRKAVPDSTTLIMSQHNFTSTQPYNELKRAERQMRALGADVVKLAMNAQDITDAGTLLRLLQERTGALATCAGSSRAHSGAGA
jgi:3-dehydroquinate dehydratase / shikimate dehydrogenase